MGGRETARLAYDEGGHGAPPVVLVHGWGTDRRVLKRLFDEVGRARRVVSVDLRGFGESAGTGAPQTIHGHADDVAGLLDDLGLAEAVVVGHSMGGLIALAVAARHGARLSAAVLLEALVVPPAETLAGLREVLGRLRSDRCREVVTRLMSHLAGPDMAPEARALLASSATACPQELLTGTMEDMLAFDSAAVAAQVRCPLLYVETGAPYSDLARLRTLCPQLVTRKLAGRGHYFPLEMPEEVGAMIAQFVETLVGRPEE